MLLQTAFIKLTCLLSLLITSSTLFAQVDIVNITFDVKDSNVIFLHTDNSIKLIHPNTKKVQLRAYHSQISKDSDSIYKLMIRKEGRDTLEIISNNKVVFRKLFFTRRLEDGAVFLGVLRKNSASKEEIIANRGLVYRNLSFNCSIPFTIYGYRISIDSRQVSPADKEIAVAGAMLSPHAVSIIRLLQKDDVITLYDIRLGISPNYCPRSWGALSIRIQ